MSTFHAHAGAQHTGVPELLSAPMLADLLGVELRTVYGLVQGRRIAAMRIGRELRFSQAAVQDYLDSVTVPALPRHLTAVPEADTDVLAADLVRTVARARSTSQRRVNRTRRVAAGRGKGETSCGYRPSW